MLGRNTQESWEYVTSGTLTPSPEYHIHAGKHDHIARDSIYDNAYISHTIPRTNENPRWIRTVTGLIQEDLWLEMEKESKEIKEIFGVAPDPLDFDIDPVP